MKIEEYDKYYWSGKKIRLRPMVKEDAAVSVKENTDSEAERCLNYGIPLPRTLKDAEEFAEKFSNFNNSGQRIMFSIETLAGQLVGGINIHSMNRKNGTFSTGERCFKEYRRKGYMTEAKILVLKYCFRELRYNKYNVQVFSGNTAMLNHIKKIGCIEEGRIRQHIYTDGKYHDEIWLGMTREEFDRLYPDA